MAEPTEAEEFIAREAEALIDVLGRAGRGAPAHALAQVFDVIVASLQAGGTLFFAGNGGSAADAGHLAAEFAGRCTRERGPFAAVSLAEGAATVTAVANDYGYVEVFARQVRALARAGDVVILLSTSGRSANVVAAARAAREVGAAVVAFVGEGPSELASAADVAVHAPSTSTQRIQEVHQLWGHALAAWVDRVVV